MISTKVTRAAVILSAIGLMVFRVQDPAMLKQLKAGDKVKFDADRINGQFTVTKIEKAR